MHTGQGRVWTVPRTIANLTTCKVVLLLGAVFNGGNAEQKDVFESDFSLTMT